MKMSWDCAFYLVETNVISYNKTNDVSFIEEGTKLVIFQSIVLLILFLIELAALASFAYWGFHLSRGWVVRAALGIGAPLVVAIFWGLFVAPKATFPVSIPVRHLLQIAVFSLASIALYASGQKILAVVFFVAAWIIVLLVYLMKI